MFEFHIDVLRGEEGHLPGHGTLRKADVREQQQNGNAWDAERHFGSVAVRMTVETRAVVERIPLFTAVLVGQLDLVAVAVDTSEHAMVRTVCVAIGAGVPFSVVVPAVDLEIVLIMIESRRLPTARRIAWRAIGPELHAGMVRERTRPVGGQLNCSHSGGRNSRLCCCTSIRLLHCGGRSLVSGCYAHGNRCN